MNEYRDVRLAVMDTFPMGSMMKYEIQLQITEFSAMTILLRASFTRVQNNMTSQYIRLPIKAI